MKRKFSSFFKSLVIELDKDLYGPDNHLVEWHRTPTTQETDGFQVRKKCYLFKIFVEFILMKHLYVHDRLPTGVVYRILTIVYFMSFNTQIYLIIFCFKVKRPGDKNVRCTILLLLDYQPLQFKLDPRLARLLGVHTQTRPVIISALWQYIKTHKLQVCLSSE